MKLYEAMRSTAATRRYGPEPVDDDALHRVLDHARFAPSGGNRQPWRVVVVRDAGQKRRLREQYGLAYRETAMFGTSGLDHFAAHLDEVPVLLMVWVELSDLTITDGGLDRQSIVGGASIYPFVQNILLGLRNEGLAGLLTTVVIPREGELREIFSVPDGLALACVIPVGRTEGARSPLSRRPVEEFTSVDRFGGEPLRPAGG